MNAMFRQQCAALDARLRTLPDKPEETAAATLKVLWHLAAGQRLSVDAAHEAPLTPLDDAALSRLAELTAQRLAGTPLAHLSCRQRFMGLDMLAGPEALIPRRETELLARAALALLQDMKGEELRVLDVCTGAGNLALTLAQYEVRARVFASDLSAQAIALAARNAEHLGLSSRVEWRSGNLLEPFDEQAFHESVDLLVCNPPYISSQKVDAMDVEISGFEPRLAFDGGPLGVRILQRLIREAPRYLKPGGWVAFEIGLGQGAAVQNRLRAAGTFAQIRSVPDSQGVPRCFLAAR